MYGAGPEKQILHPAKNARIRDDNFEADATNLGGRNQPGALSKEHKRKAFNSQL